jgi:hypothetical protein
MVHIPIANLLMMRVILALAGVGFTAASMTIHAEFRQLSYKPNDDSSDVRVTVGSQGCEFQFVIPRDDVSKIISRTDIDNAGAVDNEILVSNKYIF